MKKLLTLCGLSLFVSIYSMECPLPKKQRVINVSQYKTCTLDLQDQKLILPFQSCIDCFAHNNTVPIPLPNVTFSSDFFVTQSLSQPECIYIWNKDGSLKGTKKISNLQKIYLSPDAKYLLTESKPTNSKPADSPLWQSWDLNTLSNTPLGTNIILFNNDEDMMDRDFSVIFNPSGDKVHIELAYYCSCILDFPSLKSFFDIPITEDNDESCHVNPTYSNDGKYLVTSVNAIGKVIDLEGKKIHTLEHEYEEISEKQTSIGTGYIYPSAIDQQKEKVAFGFDNGYVLMWNSNNLKTSRPPLLETPGDYGNITELHFLSGSLLLVLQRQEEQQDGFNTSHINIWNLKTKKNIPIKDNIKSITVAPSHTFFVTLDNNNNAHLYIGTSPKNSLNKAKEIKISGDSALIVSYSDDSFYVWSNDGTLQLTQQCTEDIQDIHLFGRTLFVHLQNQVEVYNLEKDISSQLSSGKQEI